MGDKGGFLGRSKSGAEAVTRRQGLGIEDASPARASTPLLIDDVHSTTIYNRKEILG